MHMTQRKKTGPTGPLCYAEEGEGKKLKSGRTENAPRCCGRKESGGENLGCRMTRMKDKGITASAADCDGGIGQILF